MKKLFVAVLVMLMFVGLSGCGSDSTEKTKEEVKTEFQIGETATYEKVDYTVAQVAMSEGSEYNKPEDGKVFVIVSLKIVNNSDGKIDYNPFNWKVVNSQGQEDDYSITGSLQTEHSLDSGSLIGGGSVEGDVVFEEPIDGTLKLNFYNTVFDSNYVFDFVIRA